MIKNFVQNTRAVLKFAAVVAILVVLNVGAARLDVQWDMTEADLYSITDRSRQIVRSAPVMVESDTVQELLTTSSEAISKPLTGEEVSTSYTRGPTNVVRSRWERFGRETVGPATCLSSAVQPSLRTLTLTRLSATRVWPSTL